MFYLTNGVRLARWLAQTIPGLRFCHGAFRRAELKLCASPRSCSGASRRAELKLCASPR